jgi:serine/threonine-protein kinase
MIGKTFGKYKIVERIGAGGMGEVYKALDLKLSREVALKFLSREMTRDKNFVRRFIREAQAASALDHPNVCTIHEIADTNDARMFISMAYYEGEDLRSRIARGALPIDEAIAHAAGIADGLEVAHRKGVVHRDLKPANIVITADGVAKVLDFGLAKVVGRSDLTGSKMTLGTLAYMSPEQTQSKRIDHRTDIFSLGVTLYEMLTGVNPFFANNDAAVVYQIVNVDPKPPSEMRPGLPKAMDRILGAALAKHPNDRYRTMAEYRDDLLEVLREISPSRALRLKSVRRARTRAVRRWLPVAAVGVAVAAVAIIVAIEWDDIRERLGINGMARVRGVAVMPLSSAGSGAADVVFARGMAYEIAERITRFAMYDGDLWVVPQHRVAAAVIHEHSDAKAALGVGLLLVGSVERNSDSEVVSLDLVDARTMRSVGRIRVPTETESWSDDIDDQLIRALDVRLDGSERGAIAAADAAPPGATRFLVAGQGWLAGAGADNEAELDSAIAALDRAIAADSSFAAAHVCRARALEKKLAKTHDARWVNEALLSCGRALRIDNLCAAAYAVRGKVRRDSGDAAGAIEDFERAVKIDGRDPDARHDLAFAYLQAGRRDDAELACRTALEANSRYWGPYEDLGYIYYVLGRYDDAIAHFNQVVRLAPGHAPTYNYLGALYYFQERWDDAIAMFEKSFALKKNYESCSNLGALYHMLGRFSDAARMYEWALEYGPSDYRYLVIGNLASACHWIPGESERATSLFEEAIRLVRAKLVGAPGDADLLSILAGYYSIDHADSAVRYAERALSAAPGQAGVLYRSAVVYETVGNRAKALALLGQAIANGQSVKEIEHEQHLAELRRDSRYKLLMADRTSPAKK